MSSYLWPDSSRELECVECNKPCTEARVDTETTDVVHRGGEVQFRPTGNVLVTCYPCEHEKGVRLLMKNGDTGVVLAKRDGQVVA